MTLSRRNFLKAGGAALGTAALFSGFSPEATAGETKTNLSFGFQTWTLRDELGKDLPGTLKKMAEMGYSEVEMCSPPGYSGTPFAKFNKLSGTELRKIIEGTGLKCTSTHYAMSELRDQLENRIEWAQQMGMKQMICSSLWLPDGSSVDDYRKGADELNTIGKKVKDAGLQLGFHNHHMEFEKRGEVLIYDVLLEQLDPELVKMQFQVAVVNIGYKAADYFRKYPGRFISAHLADWSATKKEQVAIGQGVVDWKDFFAATKTGGVKNVFVEMDPATFKDSAEFLRKM
jgi:sugar phosphate isomerase/epimerase